MRTLLAMMQISLRHQLKAGCHNTFRGRKRGQTLVWYKLNAAELCCHLHEETAAILVRDLRESSHRPHQRKRWRQEHITVRSLRPCHSKFTRSRPSMDTAHATNWQIKEQQNVFLTFDARVYQKRQQKRVKSLDTYPSQSIRQIGAAKAVTWVSWTNERDACMFCSAFLREDGRRTTGMFSNQPWTSHSRRLRLTSNI